MTAFLKRLLNFCLDLLWKRFYFHHNWHIKCVLVLMEQREPGKPVKARTAFHVVYYKTSYLIVDLPILIRLELFLEPDDFFQVDDLTFFDVLLLKKN